MIAGHLFVYGTLRRGSDNQFARLLEEQAQYIGPARVAGRLYDFGSYPGARRESGWITGEIFRLDPLSQLLGVLDEYEGPEYERGSIMAGAIECWIYWYVGPAPGQPIASGDWIAR